MDEFLDANKIPFLVGLGLGLLLAFFAWKSGISNKMRLSKDVRRLENELRELQSHLNTQLKINASGNQTLEAQLDDMKRQNENLRVSMATFQNKPGRAEVRQYQILETAVRTMREQAPGFAPAWEKAVRQAETEVEAGENGLRKLVRKVMPGIGMSSAAPQSHSENDRED